MDSAEPITLAGAAAVATIISAGFTAIGFFSDREAERKIIGLLKEIRNYIISLDRKIEEVKRQNEEIIAKLDQLPSIVQRLLREETLNEKYSHMDTIRNNFFELPGGDTQYEIHSNGWEILSEVLTFILKHEFRLSKGFDILRDCEFYLVATRRKSTPIVTLLLREKIEQYRRIKEELILPVEKSFGKVMEYLKNKDFIVSYNLSHELGDLAQFTLVEMPNLPETESYRHETRHRAHEEPPWSTYDIRTRRSATGIAYNKAKAAHLLAIKNSLADYLENLKNYMEVARLVEAFQAYTELINRDQIKANLIASAAENKSNTSVFFVPV